jgi:hypothetical protein
LPGDGLSRGERCRKEQGSAGAMSALGRFC